MCLSREPCARSTVHRAQCHSACAFHLVQTSANLPGSVPGQHRFSGRLGRALYPQLRPGSPPSTNALRSLSVKYATSPRLTVAEWRWHALRSQQPYQSAQKRNAVPRSECRRYRATTEATPESAQSTDGHHKKSTNSSLNQCVRDCPQGGCAKCGNQADIQPASMFDCTPVTQVTPRQHRAPVVWEPKACCNTSQKSQRLRNELGHVDVANERAWPCHATRRITRSVNLSSSGVRGRQEHRRGTIGPDLHLLQNPGLWTGCSQTLHDGELTVVKV